ncbi:MAG: phosphopentomutase [Deltaproteobacteria bacterium]|nr:phosphopentomutase [Deltaproteobacteria bacterium]
MVKEAKRVVLIVIDSLGIGELPDAHLYKDEGSHTIDNTAKAVGGLELKNLSSMGLGLIEGVNSVKRVKNPLASYGRMMEVSPGKDTTTGHWELSGVIIRRPFATFPEGFPAEIMEAFRVKTGREGLWGKPASGTEIIERLGEEHIRTRKPIVYTSADSVFQIAAHEDVMPVEELYRVCRVAREFISRYNVARVIARPFAGSPGSFVRTVRRRDFSIEPPGETLLDRLRNEGIAVVGIGKVGDIFSHRGFSEEVHAKDNSEVMDRVDDAVRAKRRGLIFANLVDFDMLYGHRNDAPGYAKALEEADRRIGQTMRLLKGSDMLVLTADHGCDPTTPSTDHSREYVPLLVWGGSIRNGVNLGTRKSFSDVGQTVAEFFGCGSLKNGTSFLSLVLPPGKG